jgi:tRNA G18 (ribose-2'-O)-methylase SpoU
MRKLKNEELGRVSPEEFRKLKKLPIVVVLDNIRSMHNVGSVFRTSDAFLVDHIMLTGITAQPPHREIHKTALGATESVSWSYFAETLEAIKELKNNGYTICSIEQADSSTLVENFQPQKSEKYALVFGHEVFGVTDDILGLSDACLEIPQSGTKHSLNISVSAGIILWHFFTALK